MLEMTKTAAIETMAVARKDLGAYKCTAVHKATGISATTIHKSPRIGTLTATKDLRGLLALLGVE